MSPLGADGQPIGKRYLTTPELSEYAGLPVSTIRTWTCLRRFPPGAVVRLGRSVRFDKIVIDAWIESGREHRNNCAENMRPA